MLRSLIALAAVLTTTMYTYAQEPTDLHFSFTEAEAWSAEKLASTFTLDEAAKLENGVVVQTKKTKHYDGCLILTDHDKAKSPNATLPLSAPAANGELDLLIATSGTQKQHASISLMSGDSVLAQLKLESNYKAYLIVGKDNSRTIETKGKWYLVPHRFVLSWQVNVERGTATVSVRFEETSGDFEPTVYENVPMAAIAKVDAIRFSAGFGKAISRGLLIDDLKLTAK